jgi:hypothetical protein
MTTAHKVTVGLAGVLFALLCFIGYGLFKEHDAKIIAEANSNSAQQQLKTIASSEAANQAGLKQTISDLEAVKQKTVTTTQIVHDVPQYITLPTAIKEVVPTPTPATGDIPSVAINTATETTTCKTGDLVIAADSAKAFFDSQVTCKENAATVASQKQTIADLNTASGIKDAEISTLQTQLKGGTWAHRALVALKWTGIGIAIGGGAVLAAHH